MIHQPSRPSGSSAFRERSKLDHDLIAFHLVPIGKRVSDLDRPTSGMLISKHLSRLGTKRSHAIRSERLESLAVLSVFTRDPLASSQIALDGSTLPVLRQRQIQGFKDQVIAGSSSFEPIIEALHGKSLLGCFSTLPAKFEKLLPRHVPKDGSREQEKANICLFIIGSGHDVMNQG
jgi:hypothetical protein